VAPTFFENVCNPAYNSSTLIVSYYVHTKDQLISFEIKINKTTINSSLTVNSQAVTQIRKSHASSALKE